MASEQQDLATDEQQGIALTSPGGNGDAPLGDPTFAMLEAKFLQRAQRVVLKGTIVRKPMVLFAGGLAWAASSGWLNAALVTRKKLAAESSQTDTFYLWMYAIIISLVIYPGIYLGLRQYDKWLEKEGRDTSKLSHEKQLQRKIVETNVNLLSSRISYVAVMAWSAALLDSNPYSTEGPGWAWTTAALILCGGSVLAYIVLQFSQSQKEDESKRVVLDKMSHLVASNFGWSLGSAIGTGILLSISSKTSDISEMQIFYAWLYFLGTVLLSFFLVRAKARAVPHLDKWATDAETELRMVGSKVELDLYRIVPELRELVSFVDELSMLGLVWMAAIAFQNAIQVWLVYPASWDDLDNKYNDGFFIYAAVVTVLAAGISEVMEYFLNWRLTQPVLSTESVLFWEHACKLLTLGLAYIAGSAWTNAFTRVISDVKDDWVYALIYAVGISTIAALASFGVAYFYPKYNTKVIDVDFDAFKPKKEDIKSTA